MTTAPITLEYYQPKAGQAPYTQWFRKLRDPQAKARILLRLDRVQEGNLGDSEPVGEGVIELKIDYGPGYRIYCLREGDRVVLLLCGGTKKSQRKDIEKAKTYARDYRSR